MTVRRQKEVHPSRAHETADAIHAKTYQSDTKNITGMGNPTLLKTSRHPSYIHHQNCIKTRYGYAST